ncbi:hypothetical protein BpHYR1_040780 [Brachionus plicatilis]|uniref:Uncharacterized protein n=1 Tax=Brachionus plicatilis TaxID=10195 RepID=A0A3M7Q1Z0_BRAPC|nr:hypothetical protein BpHYR1_040780 [Brachionus plicatilis]
MVSRKDLVQDFKRAKSIIEQVRCDDQTRVRMRTNLLLCSVLFQGQ